MKRELSFQPKKKRWEIRLKQILTEEEIAQVIFANFIAKEKAFKNSNRAPVIEWMILNTSLWGLRISESAHLECGQVYIGNETSHIDLQHTKGNKPRDVYIGPLFSSFLQEYLDWKISNGEPMGKHDPFFLSRSTKTFMTPEGLRKSFKRAIRRSGISKPATPHTGRHTLGTLMAPTDLRVVQKTLGHRSLATTEIYSHVLNFHIQQFVEKYESLLYSSLQNI